MLGSNQNKCDLCFESNKMQANKLSRKLARPRYMILGAKYFPILSTFGEGDKDAVSV